MATAIRAVQQSDRLAFAQAVGSLVLDEIYDGDVAAYRARGRKAVSLRCLAAHLDGYRALDARKLGLCVRVTAFLRSSGTTVDSWSPLGLCHFRAAVRLPDTACRRVLARAREDGWSVRQLRIAVAADRSAAARRARRRRPLAVVRTVRRMAALAVDDERFAGTTLLARLPPAELARVRGELRLTLARLGEVDRRLRAFPPRG